MRWLALTLSVLLVFTGCTTTQPLKDTSFGRRQASDDVALVVQSADGSTVRIDPNTEIRFTLQSGEVTPWVRGRDLWRSDLGVSYEEGGGVFFIEWSEVVLAEARNLSALKTVGAILLVAVAVGVVVILIASKGGGNFGGSSFGGGKSKKASAKPSVRRHRLARTAAGIHVHVPLVILSESPQYYYQQPGDVAPPPPPPPPETPAGPPAAPSGDDGGPVDIQNAAPSISSAGQVTTRAARRLFGGGLRRRSRIQLIGSVAAGTELARFEGYTASAVVGMRINNAFELGAGFRHTMAPRAPSLGGDLESGLLAFGRIGGHLWLDDNHRVAIPVQAEVGTGHNIHFQTRFNLGLRVRILRDLWVGLLPFSPNFTYFAEDSPFRGAYRWTFPTTAELGFSY